MTHFKNRKESPGNSGFTITLESQSSAVVLSKNVYPVIFEKPRKLINYTDCCSEGIFRILKDDTNHLDEETIYLWHYLRKKKIDLNLFVKFKVCFLIWK